MQHFSNIYDIAAERKGGAEALEELMGGKPKSASELKQISEDRWLAAMTKSIFQAGFNWKVVESMWPGFEAAFEGFDIGHCLMLNDEDFEQLVSDKRIVRHGTKIKSVQANAAFIASMQERGGISKVIADWPSTDFIGLLALLKKQASRMGGNSAQYVLRIQGRDSFILSNSVVDRLIIEGVVDKAPTSKKALQATQEAFNIWMDQSGRSLTEVSRVLAMSI